MEKAWPVSWHRQFEICAAMTSPRTLAAASPRFNPASMQKPPDWDTVRYHVSLTPPVMAGRSTLTAASS